MPETWRITYLSKPFAEQTPREEGDAALTGPTGNKERKKVVTRTSDQMASDFELL